MTKGVRPVLEGVLTTKGKWTATEATGLLEGGWKATGGTLSLVTDLLGAMGRHAKSLAEGRGDPPGREDLDHTLRWAIGLVTSAAPPPVPVKPPAAHGPILRSAQQAVAPPDTPKSKTVARSRQIQDKWSPRVVMCNRRACPRICRRWAGTLRPAHTNQDRPRTVPSTMPTVSGPVPAAKIPDFIDLTSPDHSTISISSDEDPQPQVPLPSVPVTVQPHQRKSKFPKRLQRRPLDFKISAKDLEEAGPSH